MHSPIRTMPVPEKSSAMQASRLSVQPDQAGQRIDNYLLSHLKGVPRTHVYKILRSGEVRVNRGRIAPSYRVKAGDVIRIPPIRTSSGRTAVAPHGLQSAIGNSILFEDRALIVINKPAGIAVHGGSGVSAGVIEILRLLRPQSPYLELVHRLDKETSGCLLIAKRRSMLRTLHELLRQRKLNKHYLCLVQGTWENREQTVQLSLHRNQLRSGERMVTVADDGKVSTTRFHRVKTWSAASLMDVKAVTGRTHQIRVHAAATGHPLAGDQKYGDPQFNRYLKNLGLRRLFLHAHTIAFHYPQTNTLFKVKAPLSRDLESVLIHLDEQDSGDHGR